jgi:enterochelin esterase family protein
MLHLTSISSPTLRGKRKVWVESGKDNGQCCIFLDAELYIERVGALKIVQRLVVAKEMPATTCVYLSCGEAIDRHTDFACNTQFARFIAREFISWIDDFTGLSNEFVLCGLSLSGLAAAFAGLRHPEVLPRVLCQSPSAWWNDEWLAKQLVDERLDPLKCWISVGNQETDESATHGPTGMIQGASQLASCRRLAQALEDARATVKEHIFAGAHEPACWAAELPSALRWLYATEIIERG